MAPKDNLHATPHFRLEDKMDHRGVHPVLSDKANETDGTPVPSPPELPEAFGVVGIAEEATE